MVKYSPLVLKHHEVALPLNFEYVLLLNCDEEDEKLDELFHLYRFYFFLFSKDFEKVYELSVKIS